MWEWIRRRSAVFWAFWAFILWNGPQGLDAWSNLVEKADVLHRFGVVGVPDQFPPIDWGRLAGVAIFALILLRERIPTLKSALLGAVPQGPKDEAGVLDPKVAQTIEAMRNGLHGFVRVTEIHVLQDGFANAEPYLDFELVILNGSVFDVFLESPITGHMWYGPSRKPLSRVPEPIAGYGAAWEPGAFMKAKVRQYISDQVRQDIYSIAAGSPPCILGFDEVRVPLGARNDATDRRFFLSVPNAIWTES